MPSFSTPQLGGGCSIVCLDSILHALYRRTGTTPPSSAGLKTSNLNASLISGLAGIILVLLAILILYFVLVHKRNRFSSTVATARSADSENQNQESKPNEASTAETTPSENSEMTEKAFDRRESQSISSHSIYSVPRTDSPLSVCLDESILSESLESSSMSTIDYIVQELVEAASLPMIITEHTRDGQGEDQPSGTQSTIFSEAEGTSLKTSS